MPYRQQDVGFDWYEGGPVCRAWVNPEITWNGFVVPFVDRENLERFVAWQNARCAEDPEVYDGAELVAPEPPALRIVRHSFPDWVLDELLVVGGRSVPVWNIGLGYGWTIYQHTRDEDCDVGPDGCCRICGVDHSGGCERCGGRGFHRAECPEYDHEGKGTA